MEAHNKSFEYAPSGLDALTRAAQFKCFVSWRRLHMRFVNLIFIALILSGCATQAQKQAELMTKRYAELWNEAEQCYINNERNNQSVYNTFTPIFIEDENDPRAVQMMLISRHLTESEKTDFTKIIELNTRCRAIMIEGLADVHPDLVGHAVN